MFKITQIMYNMMIFICSSFQEPLNLSQEQMICYTLLFCKATYKRIPIPKKNSQKKEKKKKENLQILINFKLIYRHLESHTIFLRLLQSLTLQLWWFTAPSDLVLSIKMHTQVQPLSYVMCSGMHMPLHMPIFTQACFLLHT